MSGGSIARRYAKALLSLAKQDNTIQATGDQIRALAGAIHDSEELSVALTNPVFPKSDRKRVVGALLTRLGASKLTTNFSLLLLDRDRIVAMPMISLELDRMIDDELGRVAAVVTSATKLSIAQEQRLKSLLEKLSNRTVELETKEDPELLGGVVAQVGDLVYDASLRTQLKRVQASLS